MLIIFNNITVSTVFLIKALVISLNKLNQKCMRIANKLFNIKCSQFTPEEK